jgi:hypothetical protein
MGPEGTSGTQFGVQGSRWALGDGTRKPPDHVVLLYGLGLGPGTQIRLQELPSVLVVASVLTTL